MVANIADPRARRIRDILRAGNGARRTILIDDEENILQALHDDVRVDDIFVAGETRELGQALRCAVDIPVHRLSDAVASRLFRGEKRVRTFALARCPRRPTLADIVRRRGDILILDGVRLTGNIGALTRTAAAFDAAGIVLVNSGLISVYDRRLIRASRGLVFSLPVVTASRHDVPAFLVESDATLVALSVQAVDPVAGLANLPGRVAVLLGSERTGASPQLEAAATHRFSVPINAAVESLNVSVAGALALYERLHRAA